jgi:hypothetical protein
VAARAAAAAASLLEAGAGVVSLAASFSEAGAGVVSLVAIYKLLKYFISKV